LAYTVSVAAKMVAFSIVATDIAGGKLFHDHGHILSFSM